VSEYRLDARRLLCPLPVIRVQDRAQHLQPGDILEVTCTDPGALYDIPAWCRLNGHRILESRAEGRDIIIRIEIATPGP
jgi:tRNA 2-thiouridine synthesizing protein A